jgi:hypothetical protein
MRAIARRLQRLERRLGPAVESPETRLVLARLEAARLRRGLAAISPQRMEELRGMSVCRILNDARQKAALAGQRESERTASEFDKSRARPAEKEGEIG